jgi:hypothetical protein
MKPADNKRIWLRVLTPVVGLASLTWFLVRVLPKPSRAAYPCQRAAFPLASGFVIWLAGLFGARVMYRKSRDLMQRSRYAVALAALAVAAFAVWLPLGWVSDATAQFIGNPEEHFQPSEGANQPMGVGKGIHPGRVTWIRDAGSTLWDGKTGNWWDDANTDQKVVDSMISKSLAGLTGEKTDKQAWQALFQSFNQTHNFGTNGYQRGEKIAVKINANQDREKEWSTGRGVPSPHVIYSLVNQLITNAGVPGEDISIYEVTKARYISDPIVKRIWANPNPEFKKVRFVVEPGSARDGRIAAVPDMTQPVSFADHSLEPAYLPRNLTESKYLINLALFRPHTLNGVTLTAKNYYGATFFPKGGGWVPQPMHRYGAASRPPDSYNCLVDLMGSKNLGGKALLYMIDGIYSAEHNEGYIMRFKSFGDGYAASIFMSQDPVAIDSVALDFLRNEPNATRVRGTVDNYMHEAALANKPPSGTVYDPDKTGKPLASLGVHEHWNNATERKYSRNLGKNEGIELVTLPPGRTQTASR